MTDVDGGDGTAARSAVASPSPASARRRSSARVGAAATSRRYSVSATPESRPAASAASASSIAHGSGRAVSAWGGWGKAAAADDVLPSLASASAWARARGTRRVGPRSSESSHGRSSGSRT